MNPGGAAQSRGTIKGTPPLCNQVRYSYESGQADCRRVNLETCAGAGPSGRCAQLGYLLAALVSYRRNVSDWIPATGQEG